MLDEYSTELGSKLPITWNIDEVKADPTWYKPVFINTKGVEAAAKLGYTENHNAIWRTVFGTVNDKRYCYLEETLKNFPNYKHAVIWYQMQPTAAVLKTHIDPDLPLTFNSFWAKRGIKQDIKIERFRRSIIYLENHKDGHFNTVNGKMYYNWEAGNYLYWSLVPHSAGNFGNEKKYVLAIDYFI